MDLQKLGTMIRNKREEIGIPPSVLAEKTGIRRPTLWIYERGENPKTGKPSRPAKDKLERLAEVLRMSQAETEEFLSLANYEVTKHAQESANQASPQHSLSQATTITEINGTVYLATDGYLYAFDAKSGNRLWSSSTATPSLNALVTEHFELQNIIEQIEEDIWENIRKHLPRIINREFKKLEAKVSSFA